MQLTPTNGRGGKLLSEQQNLFTSIDRDLSQEDLKNPAPRVPIWDSPSSRVGELSKAVSTTSALIGVQSTQHHVDGYHTIRRYPMKTIVGIDWSRQKHQVNVFNEHGKQLSRQSIDHTSQGFAKLHKQLTRSEPNPANCLVAIETHHNLLVDHLMAHGYVVYVIAPSIVRGNRSRQSQAGAKTDDKDADLLADIVRTDRRRLIAWQPDGQLVRQMRTQIGMIDDMTTAIVRGHNRLEAHLLRYFPQATDVFSELTTQIALQLIIAYPTPSAVAQLDYNTFVRFCTKHGYRHKRHLSKRFARLKRPTPFDDANTEAVFAAITPRLAHRLLLDVRLKTTMVQELQQQFKAHPDHAIFDSIPGSGRLLAPKLLIIFGDHRTRYDSPDTVRALAGTCPATFQSGKKRGVFFRKACNKQWRNTFQSLAKASTDSSLWAAHYVERARTRGHSKSHAYRCLANRWVGIIWTLWQREQQYDEAIHWQHLKRYKT